MGAINKLRNTACKSFRELALRIYPEEVKPVSNKSQNEFYVWSSSSFPFFAIRFYVNKFSCTNEVFTEHYRKPLRIIHSVVGWTENLSIEVHFFYDTNSCSTIFHPVAGLSEYFFLH
ncbi:hypothetical protein PHYBLDRAFT_58695 [Phycomyces blakesleeanus NRRL 1555(-)]|uniref:Uncharacterized protein n=1 Tax=Phycomyces blakesleeanus (strain ATCC 8743b / DSM 1359 / FGSC 10004 / NBRC 33097 / NRRL 1555) TaxID=763407 RepID=A0A167QG72_PHYB8|nr:hypothetical protein PHYBLDRAFT_58695 [Phycomyces blakesleeanus NRRL 1555(-)]OAD79649.1 hypothetical protein PHYBLDRAFT_58695 [Phycomyces blakesleeanus NRRL 1555(-)]|eukprot:XP_018297689.1 hypothetical protein PHYBLDRAFT_58695 [Phycomyces blakesleeanus NRRL 1555(-)]